MREARQYILDRIAIQDRGYTTPCWIWQLHTNEKGYGRGTVGGKYVRIHRASYEAFTGPVPDGLVIDHLCCVTSCCNPDHLEAVTEDENVRRRYPNPRKVSSSARRPGTGSGGWQRYSTHCPNGHERTPENSITGEADGRRRCKICRRASDQRKTERRSKMRAARWGGGAAILGRPALTTFDVRTHRDAGVTR